MYDVTHGHEEGHKDGAYSDNKLHLNEWKLNIQSVCVSHPGAEAVRCSEGTKSVTISLVLRAIYKLLGNVEKHYLRQHWNDPTVPVASIGNNVKEARNTYIADLTRRWVTELSTDTKRLRVIATFLDPRYKHYTFDSEGDRRWAETALRNEWQHWNVARNESTSVLNQGNQPKRPSDFLYDSDDDEEQAPATTDELDLYLLKNVRAFVSYLCGVTFGYLLLDKLKWTQQVLLTVTFLVQCLRTHWLKDVWLCLTIRQRCTQKERHFLYPDMSTVLC